MNYYLKKQRGLLSLTVFLSAIVALGSVAIAILLQIVLDIAVSGDMKGFAKTLAFSLLYFVLLGLFAYLYSLASKKLICKIVRAIREKSFSCIIGRGYTEFKTKGTADYISALTNDIKIIEDNYLSSLLEIIQYGVMFIASVAVMFYFDVFIALCVLGAIAIMLIVPGLFGAAIQKRQGKYSNSLSEFTGNLKDILSGFDVIKAYEMRNYVSRRFDAKNKQATDAKYGVDKIMAANESVSMLLGIFVQISAIFLSAYFVLTGRITVGVLVGVIQASGMLTQPLLMIFQNAPKIKGVLPVIERLNDFSSHENATTAGVALPTYEKSISAERLTFSYDGENEVLRDVGIDIQKGKKYAIVGKNGCGKTTLSRLLCGYYSNYQGLICYDNSDLKEYDYDEIAKLSSTIHQDVYIFNESIYDNICLHEEYSDDELKRALKLSGVSDFINQMPDGLNTLIMENGANLSGGQKQRIAVARAIIRKKPILILDEGTSAIDMQTAYDIESSLLSIADLTLITITHNLREENLQRYNQIIFMDSGTVKEIGTYEELAKRQGEFYFFSQPNDEKTGGAYV
jgi:ABC-type multidrug transport system, ATPase and permease components